MNSGEDGQGGGKGVCMCVCVCVCVCVCLVLPTSVHTLHIRPPGTGQAACYSKERGSMKVLKVLKSLINR